MDNDDGKDNESDTLLNEDILIYKPFDYENNNHSNHNNQISLQKYRNKLIVFLIFLTILLSVTIISYLSSNKVGFIR